jgi:hypothetical protein
MYFIVDNDPSRVSFIKVPAYEMPSSKKEIMPFALFTPPNRAHIPAPNKDSLT